MANYLVLVENAKYRVSRALGKWESDPKASLLVEWRRLSEDLLIVAYARLFGQLDIEAFWRSLSSVAATSRGYLSGRVSQSETERAPSSWNEAVLCATALGAISLAKEIAGLFAEGRATGEYADEFHRAAFLRELLRQDGPLISFSRRVEEICDRIEGDLEEAPTFLDFFRAIGRGDAEEIALALRAWAEKTSAEFEERASYPSAPPEAPLMKGLWLEGLAYVRLLESRGVELPDSIPLIPKPVRRIPRGALDSGLDLFSSGATALEQL